MQSEQQDEYEYVVGPDGFKHPLINDDRDVASKYMYKTHEVLKNRELWVRLKQWKRDSYHRQNTHLANMMVVVQLGSLLALALAASAWYFDQQHPAPIGSIAFSVLLLIGSFAERINREWVMLTENRVLAFYREEEIGLLSVHHDTNVFINSFGVWAALLLLTTDVATILVYLSVQTLETFIMVAFSCVLFGIVFLVVFLCSPANANERDPMDCMSSESLLKLNEKFGKLPDE